MVSFVKYTFIFVMLGFYEALRQKYFYLISHSLLIVYCRILEVFKEANLLNAGFVISSMCFSPPCPELCHSAYSRGGGRVRISSGCTVQQAPGFQHSEIRHHGVVCQESTQINDLNYCSSHFIKLTPGSI